MFFDALEQITQTENKKNPLRLAPRESVVEGGETKQMQRRETETVEGGEGVGGCVVCVVVQTS